MTDPASDLLDRQAGVWAVARTQAIELLWQRCGQPTDGYQELADDAEAVARTVFEIVAGEADLFASAGTAWLPPSRPMRTAATSSCGCASSASVGARNADEVPRPGRDLVEPPSPRREHRSLSPPQHTSREGRGNCPDGRSVWQDRAMSTAHAFLVWLAPTSHQLRAHGATRFRRPGRVSTQSCSVGVP
jgi:hypothetical protein